MFIHFKTEFGPFVKWMMGQNDADKVTDAKHDDILEWGNKAVEDLDRSGRVELPVLFQGLYRDFQKSKDYSPDSNALLLEAEQRANPPQRLEGPDTQQHILQDRNRMREKILQAFGQGTGATKSASERMEFSRSTAARLTALAGQAPAEQLRMVMRDPFQRGFWSGFGKALGGGSRWLTPDERDAVEIGLVDENGRGIFGKSLTAGSSPGTVWLSEDVAKAVFDICPLYGAYKTLRVIQLAKGRSKFVKVTALPTAVWLIPNALQGTTIPADGSLSGAAVSQECNTLAVNIEVSEELLQDEKVDWGTALLEKIARGLAAAIDWACLGADGTADMVDGGQTGIFKHGSVPVVSAASGHTDISTLVHDDFLLAPAAILPAGLQREGCRWWVNPAFLPKLLLLKDGNLFLCQTPSQNPSGEYTLCGWPMTLTTCAPGTSAAGQPVAAFGWGEAFTIGMREDAEIMTGAPRWNQALKNIRALTRCRCDMGDAGMFAILKLAAA